MISLFMIFDLVDEIGDVITELRKGFCLSKENMYQFYDIIESDGRMLDYVRLMKTLLSNHSK